MLLSLCFICIVIIIFIYFRLTIKKVLQDAKKNTRKKNKCKNQLLNYISKHNLGDDKYLIRNLDGLSISYDINNLQQKIFHTKRQTIFNIENKGSFSYIYTNTNPRLYLNTNIDGEIRFKLDKNLLGNKWIFLKLDTDDLLKRMLVHDVKHTNTETTLLYNKYNFIHKNGYFIQSLNYSYFISNNKCDLCPNLTDILIISKK